MTFDRSAPRNPREIRQVSIVLDVVETGGGRQYEAQFSFVVLDEDGQPLRPYNGNLVPHLTQQQINQLRSFMDSMLDKARAEVL